MESVRRALPGDAVEVTALCRGAVDELRPNRGGDLWSRYEARPEPMDEAIRDHLVDADKVAHVGLIDDVVVGYALGRFEQLHDGELILVVSDIYIVPEAREIGLGELLIERLMADARERGAVGIDAFVLPGDRAAKNFFESHGMKARALLVHRSLDSPGEG